MPLTLSLKQNSSNPCKTLSNKSTRSILFPNEVTLGGSYTASGCRLLTRKTKPRMKPWNFQPYPPFSIEGRGARKEVVCLSSLCKEASIKVPVVGGLESLQVGKHGHVRRETHLSSTGTELPVLRTLSGFATCILSSVSFIIPFPNWKTCFPELCKML